MDKFNYIRLAFIFFISTLIFQNTAIGQNIIEVFAVDDSLSVDQGASISIDVTCNDYIHSDLESRADLIIGSWKLQYLSGGIGGIEPFSSGNDNDLLTFTNDSLFGISDYYGYDFTYEGPYDFTEDYLPGIDLLQLTPPSPFFVNDQALIYELSDSILVISDAAIADGFEKHFVRTNMLTTSIIGQPAYGNAIIYGGDLIYSSNSDYVGTDTVTYVACDTTGMVCDTAVAIFYVLYTPPMDANTINVTANDNYYEFFEYGYTYSFNALDNISYNSDSSNITITTIETIDCASINYDENSNQIDVTPITENWNGNNTCEFYYVACNQFNNCDTVNITLAFLCFPWDYPASTISDSVIIESYSAEIPLFNPCSEAATFNLESVAIGQAQIQTPVIVYTPPINYTGFDTLYYYVDELSSVGCIVCGEYIEHIVYVADGMYLFSIWPGDANVDGIVNNIDVLTIGFRYGNEGPPRTDITDSFESLNAIDWTTNVNGLNDKFSDCNGDGTIDNLDVGVINTNYNQTHSDILEYFYPLMPLEVFQPEIEFIEDTVLQGSEVTLIINIGDFIYPVDIYGLAFTLSYDTALVQQNSVNVVYDNSPLDVNNPIVLEKDFYEEAKLDFALSKTDMINSTSTGTVAAVTLIIEENLDGKMLFEKELTVSISNCFATLATGEYYQLANATASTIAISDVTDNVVEYGNGNITLAPNPAKDIVLISTDELPIEGIQMYNTAGQLVQSFENLNTSKATIDLSNFENGTYYLLLNSGEKWYSKRVSKISD